MEESGVILILRVLVDPKRIIEESVSFFCNSIVYRRRMIKSIYIVKHRFIKAILLSDVIENRSQCFLMIIFFLVMWQKIVFYSRICCKSAKFLNNTRHEIKTNI